MTFNMNENDPDNFFENIPETEESTFTFDDVSLRVAREAVNVNYKESDVSSDNISNDEYEAESISSDTNSADLDVNTVTSIIIAPLDLKFLNCKNLQSSNYTINNLY